MVGGLAERNHFFGGIFFSGQDGPKDRHQESRATDPEGVADGVGNAAAWSDIRNAGQFQRRRNQRAQYRARTDEGGLHSVAGGVLVLAQHVADESAERLHGDVETGVEHPEQHRREQQDRRERHQEQRQRGKDCTKEEVGPAASQAAEPRLVRHVTDDRLNEQSSQRRSDPQSGKVV